MAINWDKEYGTSEPKKSKINWEKEYNPTGFKERIDTEKADLRSKGLPVSVRDDRSAPTKGGSILRDILKVPATLLARPGQALGAIQGLTPEEQTVKSKYLGDIKTVQTGKDVLSDVGRGLELASYGVGIGAGKNILAQSGKQAAKQIAKRTALEGAIGGFTGSAGRVITNQSGNLKQDLKDIALGTGIGTIAGGALGYAGGRLGGKLLSAEERAMERAVGKGGKFNIPEVGTPEIKTQTISKDVGKIAKETPTQAIPDDPIISEAKKYKSAEDFVKAQPKLYHGGSADIKDIQLGKSNFQKTFYMSENPDYAKSFGGNKSSLNEIMVDSKAKLADLRKPSDDLVKQIEDIISSKPTGKTIRIQKPDGTFLEIPETKGGLSNPVHSSEDIINGIKQGKAYFAEMPEVKNALKKLGYDGQITSEVPYAKNIGVWNKEVIKTKSQLEEIWKKANQATPNTPETKTPTVKTTKITENKVSEKEIEYLRNTLPEDEALKVDSITLKDIKEKSIKFIEDNGIEKSKRIALGIEPEPYKYGSQGIHAELSNYAARTGDGELLSELAQVDISKEAAQRTGLGRIREPDNPFYIIKDINNELNKKQNIVNKMNQKFEMNNIIDKLKNKLSNIAELSEEQVVKIARKLVCK